MRRTLFAMITGGAVGALFAWIQPTDLGIAVDVTRAQTTERAIPSPTEPVSSSTGVAKTAPSSQEVTPPDPQAIRIQRAQHLSRFGKQAVAPAELDDRYREPAVRAAMSDYFAELGGAAPDVNCDYYPCIVVGLVSSGDIDMPASYPHAKSLSISRDHASDGLYRVSIYLPAAPMEGTTLDNLEIRRIQLRSMEMTMNSVRETAP